MINNNSLEDVISLTVPNGSSTASATKSLQPGVIARVAAFFQDYSSKNAGFVRLSIKDSNGYPVSQMQSIENYRDRNADYYGCKKPLQANGGENYTITVQATENFTADFLVDVVFVYPPEMQQQ